MKKLALRILFIVCLSGGSIYIIICISIWLISGKDYSDLILDPLYKLYERVIS